MRACIALLILVASAVGCAKQQSAAATDKEIKGLVAQLHSPNKAPSHTAPSAIYPESYDKKAQEKVREAFGRLYQIGPIAFPFLLQHLDNQAYCFTEDNGNADQNFTVGKTCRFIFESQLVPCANPSPNPKDLQKYSPVAGWPDCVYLHTLNLYNPKAFSEWYATRSNKSLQELQIEILEGTIAEETKAPEEYPADSIAVLKAKLTQLRSASGPLESEWWLWSR